MAHPFNRVKLGLVVAAGVIFIVVVRIAYHHYESVAYDFESTPPSETLLHPEQLGMSNVEEVKIELEHGSLSGWYVPSRNRAAIVITHGTNSDRTSMLAEFRTLADAGFGVLVFDWPGCGLSPGSLSWGTPERQALVTAITWLQAQRDVDSQKIGGLGFSMGSYIMAGVSANDPRLHAVVLEGTPTGYRDIIQWQNRKWGWLSELPAEWAVRRYGVPKNELRPLDVISQIAPRPLLLVAGDQDEEVPPFMAQSLLASAGAPKSVLMVAGAGHGEYDQVGGLAYRKKLIEFFTTGLLSN